jgi:ribosome-interacting GTPase 1
MPSELLTAIPALAGLVEKAGIIGLLLIVVGMLIYERLRLLKELTKTLSQRDKWRLAYVKCKDALDHHGVKVDLTDLANLIEGES